MGRRLLCSFGHLPPGRWPLSGRLLGGEVFPALGHSPFFGHASPLQPCAQKLWPLYLGIFVNGAALPALGSAPHARGATPSVLVSALSAGSAPLGRAWFLGERSSPRYSSFCGPAPSPAMCSQANVSLRRGPPRATKVQQLLIFGVPPSPGEAAQGGGGLLQASGESGDPARFSPDFRVLSQKMGRRGLARGFFRILWGISPLTVWIWPISPL